MALLAHRVDPGKPLKLSDIDPEDKGPFDSKNDPAVAAQLEQDQMRLCELQERLYAEQRHGVLVVLQAMDTAGKDGVLRKVVGPLDSRGVHVVTFKAPNSEELAHDYMWRAHVKTPRRGDMTFFNRSHYEDVLVVRVLDLVPKKIWKNRFDHINNFEKMLTDEGTRVVKIYLHISKEEQKRRLQERLDDPEKHWKFDQADLKMRARWDDFMAAYEDALPKTSTDYAPWYVVPANRKWFRDLAVAQLLVRTLEEMDPHFPTAPDFSPDKIIIPD
jgi:PPK2 family polyphosphate:nucleotide phosphotransferase